MFLLIT